MSEDQRSAHILVIEDDASFRDGVTTTLRLAGFEVAAHGLARAALHALHAAPPELVLTDLRLPDLDGLEVLAVCRAADADLPVVLMTGHGDVDTAVRAIRAGAYDFVEKPFGRDRLITLVERGVRQYRLALENRGLRTHLAAGLADALCGRSAAMARLRELVLRLAPTPVDVLVCGETGTGKELVARALHDLSGRPGPFVAVNSAALPEGLVESELFGHEAGAYTGATRERAGRFEQAQHGTLFLDEIEAMPPALQAKLLRVLQEREVQRLGSAKTLALDVRVVAASNVGLAALVAEGRFRSDLYYRLAVVELDLVPLRERRDDIVPLFAHFARAAALRFGCPLPDAAPALHERLLAHAWPGNVRELKSAAERHVLGLPALGGTDGVQPSHRSLQATLDAIEALLLEEALRRGRGQAEAVCAELELSPATFYRKLKQHGLQARAFVRGGGAAGEPP